MCIRTNTYYYNAYSCEYALETVQKKSFFRVLDCSLPGPSPGINRRILHPGAVWVD